MHTLCLISYTALEIISCPILLVSIVDQKKNPKAPKSGRKAEKNTEEVNVSIMHAYYWLDHFVLVL